MSEKNKDTKFIRHRDGRYSINKTIKGKKKYFGSYDTLDEAIATRDELIASNWGYPDEENLTERKSGKYGRYIAFHNESYRVQKVINGKQHFFGAFKTVEEAEYLRDLLIENNWDTSNIPTKYLRNFVTNPDLERFYYIRKAKGKYIVSKIIDGKLKYFGTYDTKEEVVQAREELLNNNWQTDDESLEEKIDEYIYLIGEEYVVKKNDNEIFATFTDMAEAIKFRNLCVKNNWKV